MKKKTASALLTSVTSKLLLAKLSQDGLYSREIRKYATNEKRNVAEVRLRPTNPSFDSIGKKRELLMGISRRMAARPKRILATNNSPATPASARIGSGRDHIGSVKFFRLRLMIQDLQRAVW